MSQSRIVVACPCGWSTETGVANAGKMARCKACGAKVRVPDAPDEALAASPLPFTDEPDDDEPPIPLSPLPQAVAVPPASPPAASSPQPATPAPASAKARYSAPPEPWFYDVSVIACCVAMGVGILAGGVAFMAGFASLPSSESRGLSLLAGGTVGIILSFVLAAPLFVAIDLARNVRAIRYRIADR